MSRFPDYRPSTALRQAIAAFRAAQKDRAAAEADGTGHSRGGPDALATAPGREDAGTGGSLGDKSGANALTSGRKVDDDR